MAIKQRPSFDPKSFLAEIGEGRSFGNYRKDQIVFSKPDAGNPPVRFDERNVEPESRLNH